jgi:multiple sugar transport system ATP-binding protein
MAAVELAGIVKSFAGTAILRGVSLAIVGGEFLTLVGPSGCGKSTMLRIIAGLETQDGGEIRIGGRSVDGVPPKRRDVAMVFQSYALYPYMTVRENLALPLEMRRLRHRTAAPPRPAAPRGAAQPAANRCGR